MGDSQLIAAAKGGDEESIRNCIQAGEDLNAQDALGWTAMENAAYIGHLEMVKLLQASIGKHSKSAAGTRLQAHNEDKADHLTATTPRSVEQGESCIIVNVGSLDADDKRKALELVSSVGPEASLVLEISADRASGETFTVNLPIREDLTNKPCTFSSSNVQHTVVTFKLYQSQAQDKRLLGSGVALVGSLLATAGPGLENVARSHTAPLQETHTLKYVGCVNFCLQVVKPYAGQHQAPSDSGAGPEWSFGNRIGGHRGFGQNKTSWKFLQMGENTLGSFQKAKDLGAAFVEFDVQVTKDRIPVIYHDFLVSETGTNAPMHTLSYEQFMYLSNAQFPRKDHSAEFSRKPIAKSADDIDIRQPQMEDFSQRMTHTFDYNPKSSKPNIRGNFIQDHFTTLKECLLKLPKNLPFDIEMKYPMLFECRDWTMDPIYMELNIFIDTVLDIIYAYAGDRRIFFSSFSPELCIALSLKQSAYGVWFLNDGVAGVGDVRASSLQQAIHFARRWGLPGIVMESTGFIACPRLVEYVHSSGLKCATFGGANNDPKAVDVRGVLNSGVLFAIILTLSQIQHEAGVDAVIVDRVNLITQYCKHGRPTR